MRLKCSIPCTRNSSRDSVPADKAVLSRARFPQLSVPFYVQSEITALAVRNLSSQCKNLSSPWKNVVTHHSVAMQHRIGNIRVPQCGIEVWQYGDFPCDIPITIFNFTDFTPTISNMFNCHFMLGCHFLDILCLFHFLPPGMLEWLTVLTPCTLRAQSNMAETGYLQVHDAVNQMITNLKNITDPLEIDGLVKARLPYSHAC